jgi:uncharacterized membrane protein
VDADYLRDWVELGLRWLHVVAGIAWIGASFYFIRLDLGLKPAKERADRDKGVAGELWGVHGGGFYHSQKYKVAPPVLPDELHWFKWEAYTTWLSGFALLIVLYFLDADTRLIDPAVADLQEWEAIALSLAGIVVGWLVYDVLCRTVGQRSELLLAAGVAGLVVLAAWFYGEVFAARAAYLQVGIVIGTIMVWNVFFVIIPAHRELIRAKLEGREPDPAPGIRGKQRSVHNNYLTLPVVFTMLAGHFPVTYGYEDAWLVLVGILAASAWLRVFFNLWHQGRRSRATWLIPITAGAMFLFIAWKIEPEEVAPAAGAVGIAEVEAIVGERCASCHSGSSAPNGVRLETREQIVARAEDIERQAVDSRAMPPGNATGMTDEERAALAAWIAAGAPADG